LQILGQRQCFHACHGLHDGLSFSDFASPQSH
jgi:hypothetical protein